MSAFESLLNVTPEEKKTRGLEHTPREIAQQPSTWVKAAEMLKAKRADIRELLGKRELILTGAGSSEFVGNAVAPALRRRLQRTVQSISTTHMVTHPDIFVPDSEYLVVSFARSGNSPESIATYNLVKQVAPGARQIAITCNRDGALAKAAKADPNSLYVELPEETNDKSLVMTSSFTTMAFAAMGLAMKDDELAAVAPTLADAGRRLIRDAADAIKAFAEKPFTRACFLGSGTLNGTMQECHLKLQEMTEGAVVSMFNSFVGLRHGPQVFVNKDCAVIAALSSDPFVRQYEMDMLRELKTKRQGLGTLVICDHATPDIREVASTVVEVGTIADEFRVLTDTIVGQILGTFACLRCGLKPDNPSVTGTISRVVQGVTIYPYNK